MNVALEEKSKLEVDSDDILEVLCTVIVELVSLCAEFIELELTEFELIKPEIWLDDCEIEAAASIELELWPDNCELEVRTEVATGSTVTVDDKIFDIDDELSGVCVLITDSLDHESDDLSSDPWLEIFEDNDEVLEDTEFSSEMIDISMYWVVLWIETVDAIVVRVDISRIVDVSACEKLFWVLETVYSDWESLSYTGIVEEIDETRPKLEIEDSGINPMLVVVVEDKANEGLEIDFSSDEDANGKLLLEYLTCEEETDREDSDGWLGSRIDEDINQEAEDSTKELPGVELYSLLVLWPIPELE